jgi:hypothetical protein
MGAGVKNGLRVFLKAKPEAAYRRRKTGKMVLLVR